MISNDTMSENSDNAENIEKMRQAVMRFRELLDIMRQRLEHGERAYTRLFAHLSPEQMAGMDHKALQRLAALTLLDAPTPLSQVLLDMRFHARDLERAFEEVYDRLMEAPSDFS